VALKTTGLKKTKTFKPKSQGGINIGSKRSKPPKWIAGDKPSKPGKPPRKPTVGGGGDKPPVNRPSRPGSAGSSDKRLASKTRSRVPTKNPGTYKGDLILGELKQPTLTQKKRLIANKKKRFAQQRANKLANQKKLAARKRAIRKKKLGK